MRKTTFIQNLEKSEILGKNKEVVWVPKILLSKDMENNIRKYLVDEEMVDVKYLNNLDEFDDLLDNFQRQKVPCNENFLGENIKLDRFILMDDLEAHVQESFRNSIKDLGRMRWFGVPNAINIWQPVDGGYTKTPKTLLNHEFFNWLDDEDNVKKWYGTKSHITASEKCILITKWAGNTYRQLNRPSYDKF